MPDKPCSEYFGTHPCLLPRGHQGPHGMGNAPSPPEEFVERLKNCESRYWQYMIESHDESIRREAKWEVRGLLDAAHSVIDWEVDYRNLNDLGKYPPKPFIGLAINLAEVERTLSIDTPPAADRAPKSFMQELAGHKIQPDEITESDIRKPAPEAVCKCTFTRLGQFGNTAHHLNTDCPKHGTGKRAPTADGGKRGEE
jgi:hypothetical protein